MDRRIFLTSCGSLALYAIACGAAFAKPLSDACTTDKLDWYGLDGLDCQALLAALPAICHQEISGILNEENAICIELDDLRYVLAGTRHLVYLSGAASGSGAIQDAVQQAMLAAPSSLQGIEKLLVMLTCNGSFLHLPDIEVLQQCIEDYVGKNTKFALGTIHNERMLADEIRIGILAPYATTFWVSSP